MDIIDIRPDLRMLRFAVGQAYLWSDNDGLTLVDTGIAGSGDQIAAAIGELGYRPSDLRRIVLTHFHEDHAGSAAEVRGWSGAPVLAHRLDAPIIRGDIPGPPPVYADEEERALHARIIGPGLPPVPPTTVDEELEEGDELDVGGGARVLWIPGHTQGSLALHLPGPRLLLTGDTVAEHQGQVLLGPFNLDRAQAMASFRRLAELDVDVACFGHGDPVTAKASAVLRATAEALA